MSLEPMGVDGMRAGGWMGCLVGLGCWNGVSINHSG